MAHVIPIVALDVPSLAEAQATVARVGPAATWFKVGLQLFTAEGPAVVAWLRGEGRSVFLDLKLHDIPNTVEQAATSARRMGVQLLTVHASGGTPMVHAAVQGAGSDTGILAVTVLTSMDAAALGAASGRPQVDVRAEVLRLAAIAREAGAHGIVCAGSECAAVRAAHGEHLKPLIPGIRLAGGASHDQARISTPDEAAAAGAAYIILGRAVTAAKDPAAAFAQATASLA